jgi:GTP-binding protein YchF
VDGSVDPVRDIETINLELIFADMEAVQKRGEKAAKLMKTGEKKYVVEKELADKLYSHLESGKPARTFEVESDEKQIVDSWFLLTNKKVLYVANIAEEDIGQDSLFVTKVKELAQQEGAEALAISAGIEEDIAALPDNEKAEFLSALGIGKSGLDRLIQTSYSLLGLISFLTIGEDECRAWTVAKGTKAPQAAGKIHTDFERGFIRAEVVPFDTLASLGSIAACREKGLVRSEGKEYVMQDGDVTLFRFNV